YREYVGAAQAEHQQHLHRPATDTTNLGKALNDLLVLHPADPGERRDGPVQGLGGEIAYRSGLGGGEAGLAQTLGRNGQYLSWSREPGGSAGPNCPAQYGLRSFAGELLVHDRSHQRREEALGGPRTQGEWPGPAHQRAQPGIRLDQVAAGDVRIVGQSISAGER